MVIKENYLIEKRNVLNELRTNSMTLQELRFFSIYLSRINARDISTRIVHFPLEDFQKIMDLGRVNIEYLMSVTNSLLCKVVNVPSETGGYKAFQLFKECRVDKDKNGEWYVEIDAHDKALPLMFEFKDKYFTYELWNALILKSSNQLRMYEILKQYEKVGTRTISLVDLKELLGIDAKDYPRYDNFKTRVLDSCQEALEKYTDIKFTYEPTGKKGKGVKVKALQFTISRNENYVDKLSLDDFIDMKNAHSDSVDSIVSGIMFKDERLAFLAEACNKEFYESEMRIINNLLTMIYPYTESVHFTTGNIYKYEVDLYNLLKLTYDELNLQATKKTIKNRFSYLKKILETKRKEKE